MALRTPITSAECCGPAIDPYERMHERLLIGGACNSRALVFFTPGRGAFLDSSDSGPVGQLCQEAQPGESPAGSDRLEARRQFDGPRRPGGVRSSIATLLPFGMIGEI